MKTKNYVVLDVLNYCAPNTPLTIFQRMYLGKSAKGHLPYELNTDASFEASKERFTRTHFDSLLKNHRLTDEEWAWVVGEMDYCWTTAPENPRRLFKQRYVEADVAPSCKAVQVMLDTFYADYGISLFKDCLGIPSAGKLVQARLSAPGVWDTPAHTLPPVLCYTAPTDDRVEQKIVKYLEQDTQRLVKQRNKAAEENNSALLEKWQVTQEQVDKDDEDAVPQELLDELADSGAHLPVDLESYGLLFADIGAELAVRGPMRSHPRLKILGLLEARLMPSDLALLGGLDETVWPPQSNADAFLNRPMRAELGLSSPERRIGQTAHDFAQAMGAPEVVITRAQKRGGSPTVPSRFLQRLAALAGAIQWSECKARGERALALARLIDGDNEEGERGKRPKPMPKLALRPTALSVTRIETLRRDPYSIYAERILQLKPLEPIGAEMGARLSGVLLHDVLSSFVEDHPKGRLVPGAEAELIERARAAFAELMRNAAFRAFTWPRHEFAMQQFVHWENTRRDDIANIDTEQYGKLALTLDDGSIFTLSGVADRIEHRKDGSLIVVDYKSGRVPSQKEVKAGFSPQLTLEAAMIARGAFEKVRAKKVDQALYVKIGGASGVEQTVVKSDKGDTFEDLVEQQFAELHKLLSQFRDETTAYVPRPYPQFVNAYGAYDHLARVKEWAAGGEGGE